MATIHTHRPTAEVVHPARSAGEESLGHEPRRASRGDVRGRSSPSASALGATRAAEIPTLEGEFWFIAVYTPELCEAGGR